MPDRRPRALAAIAGALVVSALAAPALAQPAVLRTPTLAGPWTTPKGTLFFAFLHRFMVDAPPTYPVTNIPTFRLAGGLLDWLSVGSLYATESLTVPGRVQELELYAKQAILDEAAGAPLSLALKEAYNLTAGSPDVELSLARQVGPVGLHGAVRGMGNYRYTGQPQAALGVGASVALTPSLRLAADAATVPFAAGRPLIWGGGLQFQIPASPHTMSLQVTNASTDTLQGSSVDTGNVRFGFDFTVLLGNADRWLAIVKPAKAEPKATLTPDAPAPAKQSFSPKTFFGQNCAGCHGPAGQGGFGPDLRPAHTKADAFIRQRIAEGSPKGMPPYKAVLSESELGALVEYVKGL